MAAIAILLMALPGAAHELDTRRPVVIDTDLGIDDAVALSIALQSPDLEIVGLVASSGVADALTATDQLARMAGYFNRTDIPIFPAREDAEDHQPEFRQRARAVIDSALPPSTPSSLEVASGEPYAANDQKIEVIVLGPLSRLASALRADPEISQGIARVIVAADPTHADDWNLGRDRQALDTVRTAGLEIVFVRSGAAGSKPDWWYTDRLAGGQRTALGERFVDRMFEAPSSRAHYLEALPTFQDELAVLYVLRPTLFTRAGDSVLEPADNTAAAEAIAHELSRGRQRKQRVVFIDGPLPADSLQSDVRQLRETILANNGPDEWFAQLLLNELHEHLGAYSIIGVKMGLRAAELLNAPQHEMTIHSSAPAAQPVSCLNDGLLVSTGSTPGRNLFSHSPGPPGTVEATFAYNGRTVTLRLKKSYQERIRNTIQTLLTYTTLEDDAYWAGVRDLGLEIWKDWHRRDLFVEEPGTRRSWREGAEDEIQPN